MQLVSKILICCIIGILLSCENELDIPLSKQANLLTLNAELSADFPISVLITETKIPYDRSPYSVPKNAVVQLFENDVWLETLNYNPSDTNKNFGVYMGKNKPKNGSTYKMEVSVPGYETMTAIETVPNNIEGGSLQSNFYPLDANSFQDAQFSIKIQDEPGIENFYLIYSYYFFANRRETEDGFEIDSTFIFSERNLPAESVFRDYSGATIFTDQQFDGQDKELIVVIPNAYYKSQFADSSSVKASLFIELRSISKNNYLYRKTFTAYRKDNGNGFTEPVIVWTNILNGFGILSSYSRKVFEYNLK